MASRCHDGASAVRHQLEMLAQRMPRVVDGRVRTAYVLNVGRDLGVFTIGVVTASDADDFVPATSGCLVMLISTGMGMVHRLLPDKGRPYGGIDYPGRRQRPPRALPSRRHRGNTRA